MGGKSKENLQLRLWNLNICIEKVDAKEMLIDEMTLVMTSLPLAYVFQCLFTFVLIDRNLTAQLTGSHKGIGGGIQIPETYLPALLPFPTPPPECPRVLALRLENHWQTPQLFNLNEGMKEGSRLYCLWNIPHNYNKSSSTILLLNSNFNDVKINHCLNSHKGVTQKSKIQVNVTCIPEA